MTPQALKTEVLTDPKNLGYEGKTDAEVAALMTEPRLRAAIPSSDVIRYLMVAGKWSRIVAISRGLVTGTDNEKLAALAIVEALANISSYNLDIPPYLGAIDRDLQALVAVDLITGDDKAAILALGNNKRSRVAELGWPPVYASDIAEARS
jgi:hypothetical protein